jgi:hypothetical protein
MKIKYVMGDMFAHFPANLPEGRKAVIAHIVNDRRAWGAGFVVPLGKKYPKAMESYMSRWSEGDDSRALRQGDVDYVCVNDELQIYVANMCAQTLGGGRPLSYDALVSCMRSVRDQATSNRESYQIHAPMFGSGLAGGNWDFIVNLIEDIWLAYKLEVTIYWLPQFVPQGWKPPKD